MEYSLTDKNPETATSACVIVGVYEKRALTPAAERIDSASGGAIKKLLKRGDLDDAAGQTLLLHDVPGTACERVLLTGCGSKQGLDPVAFRKLMQRAVSAAARTGSRDALCYLTECVVKDRDSAWALRQAILVAEDTLYRFDRLKSKKDAVPALKRMGFYGAKQHTDALRHAEAVAAGVRLAKELGNLPGNVCTPSYLADEARALVKRHKAVKLKVLELADMEKLGMGSFLSVTRGSRQAPKLIVMEYRGGKKDAPPVALVGKGITFDSGGISIKPASAMDEMKFDMCGAASVFGTVETVAELGLPINLVGIVPSCENMPDGNASKPGDIVTSLSGQTIEVLNTDAEGRLILCDALTYAERFDPEVVIDIATLTGACVVALGKHPSGLFTNDRALARELDAAGEASADRVWELPLWEDYQEQLKSNFADMANIGGRDAGAITAACFLARFTKKFRWAHLDIAGTAWHSGDRKGATGRPVPLLSHFLMARAGLA